MAKANVFVTRRMASEAMDLIQSETNMVFWEKETPPPYDILKKEAAQADGLVTMVEDRINKELMDNSPNLKVISQMAVGFDNIDVVEATKRKIPVGHTPHVLSKTTADCAFALLMAMARKVVEGDKYVRDGKWKCWLPLGFLGADVHGSTIGIIGMGAIGQEMAKRGSGFDMKIVYYDVIARPEMEEKYGAIRAPDVASVLREADFVSLHTPLMPSTHHLIGEKELASMKPSAILINTSRGPVVHLKDLYRALKDKVIAAAALDVTEPEPIDPDDPILDLDNVIVTPHIASASVVTRSRMSMMAAEHLLAGLRGEIPECCVNAKELCG